MFDKLRTNFFIQTSVCNRIFSLPLYIARTIVCINRNNWNTKSLDVGENFFKSIPIYWCILLENILHTFLGKSVSFLFKLLKRYFESHIVQNSKIKQSETLFEIIVFGSFTKKDWLKRYKFKLSRWCNEKTLGEY